MRIKELPLSDIHFIPSEYTDHLYHSIIRIGFSFPIKVKETGCGYLCVDGNKRLTALRDILEKDPLCIRLYKSTKGIKKGNCSFDDRAYLRIKIKK